MIINHPNCTEISVVVHWNIYMFNQLMIIMYIILCTLIKICMQLTHHLYLFLTSMTSLPLWSGLYQVDEHPSRFRQHSIGYHRLCRWTDKLCVFLGNKIYMKMIKLHNNTELPNSSYSKTSLNLQENIFQLHVDFQFHFNWTLS